MRIAIFLQNEDFVDESMIQAYSFSVQNDVIVGVSEELLSVRNIKHLASWLLSRNINIVFMNCQQGNKLEEALKKIDVKIRPFDDIKNNPLLQKFLMKEK